MSKISKVIFLGSGIFLTLLVFVLFSSTPVYCETKTLVNTNDFEEKVSDLHQLIAGEISTITLNDSEITQLIRQRLSHQIKNFSVCFQENLVSISFVGVTQSGISVWVNFSGAPTTKNNKLQFENVKLQVGRSNQMPFLTELLSTLAQQKINERLSQLVLLSQFNFSFKPKGMTMSRP